MTKSNCHPNGDKKQNPVNTTAFGIDTAGISAWKATQADTLTLEQDTRDKSYWGNNNCNVNRCVQRILQIWKQMTFWRVLYFNQQFRQPKYHTQA